MNIAVVVARNNLHLTKRAVQSIRAQDVHCRCFIVDNYSDDGSAHWLMTKGVDVATIVSFMPGQKSLAYCWNHAIQMCLASLAGVDRILICNNDIELRPDTFRLLSELNQDFVTCVSVESRDQLGTVGDRTAEDLLQTVRPHPDFSCFMISRRVWELVGKFDESFYPAYCEDNDYHIRMHKAGVKAVCVDLPFLHLGAQTVATASKGEAARIRRGADDNRRRFYSKWGCMPGSPEYYKLFDV